MKINKIIAAVALPVLGVAAAHAQDLYLGVRQGTSGYTYEIDLGPVSSFNQTHSFNLTAGGSYNGPSSGSVPGFEASDLAQLFASGFSGLTFGAVTDSGAGANAKVWVTQSETVAPAIGVSSAISAINGLIGGFAPGDQTNAGAFSSPGFTGSDDAVFDANVNLTNNYVGAVRQHGTNPDYGYFNQSNNSTEATIPASGSVNLPFYYLTQSGTTTEEGVFTFTNSGTNGSTSTLTYTGVPEPTTFGLLGMAAVGLVGLRRRRVAA